jgi:acyl carrier protein
MTTDTRMVVIRALDKATGVLNMPAIARGLMAGGDLRFDELDLDSLTNLEMIMEIEDSLGLELDADKVARHPTLDTLVAWLEAQVAADER